LILQVVSINSKTNTLNSLNKNLKIYITLKAVRKNGLFYLGVSLRVRPFVAIFF